MINIDNITETRETLKKEVSRRQEYMRSILDFTTGYKKLPKENLSLIAYPPCDKRMISTIKMLHCQMREFQKDIKLLDKLLKHKKNEVINNEQ